MNDAIERVLCDVLAHVGDAFAPDELAYLAATTKIEFPFRDRLAYQLYTRLHSEGLIVSREWRRVDVASLSRDVRPLLLLELKAMYTFDALASDLAWLDAETLRDERKAQCVALAETSVFTLRLATHVDRAVEARLAGIVKYGAGINGALTTYGSSAAVIERASAAVGARFTGRNLVCCGVVPGGTAFGYRVDVHYWLMRATAIDAMMVAAADGGLVPSDSEVASGPT